MTEKVPVEIRSARPDELGRIQEIERAAARLLKPFGFDERGLGDPTPVDELDEACRAGCLFVAERDGAVVAFAYVAPSPVDGNAHLAELDVHPGHGREGIGSALVRHVAAWAREAGYPGLTLTTFTNVPWNRPFYQRLGFRVLDEDAIGAELEQAIEREQTRGLDRADRVAMRLDLHDPTGELEAARRHAPATERNREAILKVLAAVLPRHGTVLEIGAGTGQHAAYFAAALPRIVWQPTDADPATLASIAAWTADVPNVRPPLVLDVRDERWPVRQVDVVVAINVLHVAPWAICLGLLRGAARVLPRGGILYLYGPYRLKGRHTAPSNVAFDRSLREENPEWGVRDLEAVIDAARRVGIDFVERVPMPANNQSVIFTRA